MPGSMNDAMDEVLDILKDTGPEWNGPLANHGPMAAEAIVTLGRGGVRCSVGAKV